MIHGQQVRAIYSWRLIGEAIQESENESEYSIRRCL